MSLLARAARSVAPRCARCAAYRRFSVATSSKSGDGANSADGGAAAGAKSTSHDEPATTADVVAAAAEGGAGGGGNHPRQAGTNKEIKPGPWADIGSDGFTWLPDEQDAEAKGRGPKPRQVGVGADDFDGDAGGGPPAWARGAEHARYLLTTSKNANWVVFGVCSAVVAGAWLFGDAGPALPDIGR